MRHQLDIIIRENHELREQNGLYQKKLTEVETQNQGLLRIERQIEAKYCIAKQKLDEALRIIENSKQMLAILQEIKSEMSQLQQNKSQILGSIAAGDYSHSKKIVQNPNHHARSLTLMEQKFRDLEKSFVSTQQDTLRLYESPLPQNNTTPIDLKMAKQRSQANRQKTPVLQNRQPHKSPLVLIKPPHETIDLIEKFDQSQLTKQEEQKRMGFLNVSTMKSHTPVVTRNDAVKKPSLLFKPTHSMANKIDESQALNTTMGSDLYPMSKIGTSFNQSNNLVAFFSSPEKRLLQGQKVDGLVGNQGLALSRKHKEENQRLKGNQKTPTRKIYESSLLKDPESKIQFENKFNLHNLLEGNEINQDDTIDIRYSEFSEKHGLTIIPQSNVHEKSFLSSMDYRSHGLEGNIGGARNHSDQQDYTIMAQKLALYELLYKQAESTSQSLRDELQQLKKQQIFVQAEQVPKLYFISPNVTLNVNTTNVTCFNIGCSQTTNNHELIIDHIQARPEQQSKRCIYLGIKRVHSNLIKTRTLHRVVNGPTFSQQRGLIFCQVRRQIAKWCELLLDLFKQEGDILSRRKRKQWSRLVHFFIS